MTSMHIRSQFNELHWHDSILMQIKIQRTHDDNILIEVQWPEDTSTTWLKFSNCYALHTKMNFGVMPPEYVLEAVCIEQSPEIQAIQFTWLQMGVDLKNLLQFHISTNSTNSSITIFSLDFEIVKPEAPLTLH